MHLRHLYLHLHMRMHLHLHLHSLAAFPEETFTLTPTPATAPAPATRTFARTSIWHLHLVAFTLSHATGIFVLALAYLQSFSL